jgi:hypothetical protein
MNGFINLKLNIIAFYPQNETNGEGKKRNDHPRQLHSYCGWPWTKHRTSGRRYAAGERR